MSDGICLQEDDALWWANADGDKLPGVCEMRRDVDGKTWIGVSLDNGKFRWASPDECSPRDVPNAGREPPYEVRSDALLADAVGLLKAAVCPSCDGSGVIMVQVSARQYVTQEMASDAGQPEMAGSLYCDDEWELQQCEWCDVRQHVIADYESSAGITDRKEVDRETAD